MPITAISEVWMSKNLVRLSKAYRSVFLYDGGKRRGRYHNICYYTRKLTTHSTRRKFFLCVFSRKNILRNLLILRVIRRCLVCGKNLLRIFFHGVADDDACIFALTMHAANQSRHRRHHDQTDNFLWSVLWEANQRASTHRRHSQRDAPQ